MAVAPTGIWNRPLLFAAEMLAAVEPFWTFVGAADSAEAQERIHFVGVEPEGKSFTFEEYQTIMPMAIVSSPDRAGWEAAFIAEQQYRTSGRVTIDLMRQTENDGSGIPTVDDMMRFRNDVGAIIARTEDTEPFGLLDLPRRHPYLATFRCSVSEGPFNNLPDDANDQGVWIGVVLLLEWGTP